MKEYIGDINNTYLAFKGDTKDINKIMNEIEESAKTSDCFIKEDICKNSDEYLPTSKDKLAVNFISIELPLKNTVSEDLTNAIGKNKDNRDIRNGHEYIEIVFDRFLELGEPYPDYWHLRFFGRNMCTRSLFHYNLNTGSYNPCPCPDEYKNFCKELGSIINKYSVRKP